MDRSSCGNPGPELTMAAADGAGSTSIRAGLAGVGGILAAARVAFFRGFAHRIITHVVGMLRALLPMAVVLLFVSVLAFRMALP